MWEHWRGRYGLSEEQQRIVWESVDASKTESTEEKIRSGQDGIVDGKGKKAEKVLLRFRTFDGEIKEVQAGLGKSLLDIGKANDLPSLEGVCGGNLGQSSCKLP